MAPHFKILKVGGSIITDKSVGKIEVARVKEMERIAEEIISAKSNDLILIHGAGSFGHPHVKKYRLTEEQNIEGIVKTHFACKKLNQIFCSILIDKGLNVLPIDSLSFFKIKNKLEFDDLFIINAVKRKIIPVFHGDLIYNENKDEFEILSGDRILYELVRNLNVERVGFAVDTEIIVDGKPIKEINKLNVNSVLKKITFATDKEDVTGGMRKKVEIALKASKFSEVYIFNGKKKGNIARFLKGERVGSLIKI